MNNIVTLRPEVHYKSYRATDAGRTFRNFRFIVDDLLPGIEDWLHAENISYRVIWGAHQNNVIVFEKDSDAVLFKLTWT